MNLKTYDAIIGIMEILKLILMKRLLVSHWK